MTAVDDRPATAGLGDDAARERQGRAARRLPHPARHGGPAAGHRHRGDRRDRPDRRTRTRATLRGRAPSSPEHDDLDALAAPLRKRAKHMERVAGRARRPGEPRGAGPHPRTWRPGTSPARTRSVSCPASLQRPRRAPRGPRPGPRRHRDVLQARRPGARLRGERDPPGAGPVPRPVERGPAHPGDRVRPGVQGHVRAVPRRPGAMSSRAALTLTLRERWLPAAVRPGPDDHPDQHWFSEPVAADQQHQADDEQHVERRQLCRCHRSVAH